MRIVGMLRVKNEARWIKEVVRSLVSVCQDVCVLTDSPSDGTDSILDGALMGYVTRYASPFQGLDEQRDKNYLLGLTMDMEPDWIIHIDGDEVLGKDSAAVIHEYINKADEPGTAWSDMQAYCFKVDYMWDRADQYRVDGRYDTFWRGSMFRTKDLVRGFRSTHFGKDGANLHCQNIPVGITRVVPIPVRLKHYGYMHKEDRLAKWEYYNRVDPGNQVEDEYRHMILGDREDLPGSMVTKWAGPLELRPWVDGKVEVPK